MDKKFLQNNILEQEYNPSVWKDVMIKVFGARKLHQIPVPIPLPANDIAEKAFELGNFYTQDERLVGIYEITLKADSKAKIASNKVGLRNLLRNIYKYDVDGALIVFIQGDKWRFSYVSEIRTEDGKKETEPKRYTYLLGRGEVCRTAADRFVGLIGKPIKLDDLFDAFNVDKLNKDFFKAYKDYYYRGIKHLSENKSYYALLTDKREKEKEKKEKPIRDFIKKLMGRIVFLHFLQKKGWMGCPVLETEDKNKKIWTDGKKRFIQLLFQSYDDKTHFHSKCLKTLFFDTLNTIRPNNIFNIPIFLGEDVKEKSLTRVPYLNGGLFEPDISSKHNIDFPVDYFKGLLDFFEQYNFTIDENDPYDSEVGIDPEMLGHIFENLLEENREKGAFYTPKDIVRYMSQESLIEYLSTHFPEKATDIEILVRNNHVTEALSHFEAARKVDELLKAVKVCDPAIGSGAFPMGMLKEIFECRRLIYPHLQVNASFNPSDIKKEIIQNNIYGVDIEPGAIDIARLRFWLALVVDETTPEPLPNLDYKIMQGNSVKENFDGIELKNIAKKDLKIIEPQRDLFGNIQENQLNITFTSSDAIASTQKNIKAYFNENDPIKKQEIKSDIDNGVHDIIDYNIELRTKQLSRWIDELSEQLSSNKIERKIKDYQEQLQNLTVVKARLHEEQNTDVRSYFLWHVFFQDVLSEGGFDIIIGNPPYIKEYTERAAFDGLRESPYYQGKMDIWYFFSCFCLDLLKPNGVECFIAQNNWITSAGASILRDKALKETQIELFTDFGDYKVFQSAGIQTMIYLLKKRVPNDNYITKYRRLHNTYITNEILNKFLDPTVEEFNEDFIKFLHYTTPEDYYNAFIHFNEPWVAEIIKTIAGNDILLFLHEDEIAQGIVPPQDKLNKKNQERLGYEFKVGEGIFQITTKERNALNLSSNEEMFIKPFYSTSQLKRYYANVETDEWLIYTKSDINKSIKQYPNLKRHFDRFKKVITSDFGPYGLHRAREEKFFVGEKIMSLRKCEKPIFTYTDFDCYVSQTYFIIKTDRVNLKFLTTILNSKLIYFWLKFKGKLQGNLFQIDKEPLVKIPIKQTDNIEPFIIMFDYLTFLNNPDNPNVNPYTQNSSIAPVFEDVTNMMIYELYFREHMQRLEIDVLQFMGDQENFKPINTRDNSSKKATAEIIGDCYKWLQGHDNPIRNRIILSNLKSTDLIKRINASSH